MKKVKYVGPSGSGVEVVVGGQLVGATDQNGVLEVQDDEVAKRLLEQDVWEPARSESKDSKE